MSELTTGQIAEAREALEQAAAELLGRVLFEFSRLEVNLGLCAVWTGSGQRLDELTKQIKELSFHKKLDFLSQHVERSLPKGSKRHTAYTEWIARAHVSRLKRNQLVHGRWGVDPLQGHVINVIGLPTSPEQTEVRYLLTDLEDVLKELMQLQANLHQLRKQWPL